MIVSLELLSVDFDFHVSVHRVWFSHLKYKEQKKGLASRAKFPQVANS
jgi:hypothetical protein